MYVLESASSWRHMATVEAYFFLKQGFKPSVIIFFLSCTALTFITRGIHFFGGFIFWDVFISIFQI